MERPADGVTMSEAGHAVRQSTRVDGLRKEPVRLCVGCRERADRSVLLRVVAAEVDGLWSAVPDPDHRRAGRGASLHPDLACLGLAERRRAFPRALRRSGALDVSAVRAYLVAQAAPSGADAPAGGTDQASPETNRPSRKRVQS